MDAEPRLEPWDAPPLMELSWSYIMDRVEEGLAEAIAWAEEEIASGRFTAADALPR